MKINHVSAPPPTLKDELKHSWTHSEIMLFGESIDLLTQPLLIAFDPEPIGWLSYRMQSSSLEILYLHATHSDIPVRERLLHEIRLLGKENGVATLRVTTNNADLKALRFYQQQGFSLQKLRPRAITASSGERPLLVDGMPIQDEIVLEESLTEGLDPFFQEQMFHVKPRLTLKPLTKFAPDELITLFSNPKVLRYQAMEPLKTPEEASAYYYRLKYQCAQRQRLVRGIFVDDEFAGLISLHHIEQDHCSLGYSLLPTYWKQGIATEAAERMIQIAFQTLNLHRIQAITHPDNIASIRVLERLRFHPEGTLIEYLRNPRTGCYENRESHALLRKNHQ